MSKANIRFPLPWQAWLIFAAVFVASLAGSYGLATVGEPQSVWLWRDVLGVLN